MLNDRNAGTWGLPGGVTQVRAINDGPDGPAGLRVSLVGRSLLWVQTVLNQWVPWAGEGAGGGW